MGENSSSKSSAISLDIRLMSTGFAFPSDNLRKTQFTLEHASQLQKTARTEILHGLIKSNKC